MYWLYRFLGIQIAETEEDYQRDNDDYPLEDQ